MEKEFNLEAEDIIKIEQGEHSCQLSLEEYEWQGKKYQTICIGKKKGKVLNAETTSDKFDKSNELCMKIRINKLGKWGESYEESKKYLVFYGLENPEVKNKKPPQEGRIYWFYLHQRKGHKSNEGWQWAHDWKLIEEESKSNELKKENPVYQETLSERKITEIKRENESKEVPKKFNSSENKRKFPEDWKKKLSPFVNFEREVLETKRTTYVTAGGRQFDFASSGLVKDKVKRLVTFTYTKGKEVPATFQKMLKKAQRCFTHFSQKNPTPQVFISSLQTVPHDIKFSYKNVTILIKPGPLGSGIRAGGVLRKLFKMIGFKDVSAKIIGSGSNLNVTRAAFLALSKINWNKDKNKKTVNIPLKKEEKNQII